MVDVVSVAAYVVSMMVGVHGVGVEFSAVNERIESFEKSADHTFNT